MHAMKIRMLTDGINSLKKKIKPFFRHLPPMRSFYRAMRKMPLWGIDDVRRENDMFEIAGWALPPAKGPAAAGFALNGNPFADIRYPLPRPDIQQAFWWVPRNLSSGFHCRTPLPRERPQAQATVTLEYVAKKTGRPFCEDHNFYYCLDDDLPIPPPEKRRRVQGTENECFFLLEGHSMYVKLQRALQKHVGKNYSYFPRLLDWGCGCGRLARHFKKEAALHLTGLDIDKDNIAWCDKNLGFGTFQSIPLHPPTRLEAGSFDLMIGISVFTHLTEDVQEEWLSELRRLAAPGAVLLMTIHGMTSFMRSGGLKPLLKFSLSRGFLDVGDCTDLGDFIDNPHYYRGIFHSAKYIKKHWSKHFDIVTIIPGYIGNNQDLVILRNR